MAEVDLVTWKSRLNEMLALHARQHRRWREAQELVEGRWLSQLSASLDPDWTPVNAPKAYVTAVVSALYARNPYFHVRARHARYLAFARSMELILNYLREELNLKANVKRCIADATMTGMGWMEVGYTATFGTLEPPAQSAGGGVFEQLLSKPKRPSEQGVLNEYVKEISAYSVRLSPWRVLLPPGYHSVSEMPYLAVAEDLAPEDLKAHPLYRRLFSDSAARRSFQAEKDRLPLSLPGMPWGFGHPAAGGHQTRFVRLWHLWDRRAMQRLLWLDGTEETAGPFAWTPSFEGFAQVPLIFNDLPESDRSANAYAIGDITFLAPQFKEQSLARTMQVKRRKRASGQIIAQENALTDEQANLLQRADDLTLIRMKGVPATDLTTFRPADLPQDVWRVEERIRADIDFIGQLAYLLPTSSPGDQRTATESRFRAFGQGIIRSEKVDLVEEFMRQIARRKAAIAWEFYPRQKIQDILGEDTLPEELWPPLPDSPELRRQMIEQELEFTIEVGSTQPLQDKTLKNEQKLRLLNILGGLAPDRIKITGEGLGKLVEDFEMPELREWMLLDDDGERQAAMQEEQFLSHNIPQTVSPNQLHRIHLEVHAAGSQQAPTPARDQHLLAHNQLLQQRLPQKPTQHGDEGGTRGVAANPESMRQGITSLSDLLSVAGQPLAERGAERGGITNIP